MRLPKSLLVTLGLLLNLATLTSVSATESSTRCDDLLIDLGSMQAALTQMEDAVELNASRRDELRTESSRLAATSADKLRDGASETEVAPLRTQRDAALADLAGHEKLRPALVRQRDALHQEVQSAERGYIACVESTL